MMNGYGLPAVFGCGSYDDIIAKAGATKPFAGKTNAELAEINAEALASAKADVLVIGLYLGPLNAVAVKSPHRIPCPHSFRLTISTTSLVDGRVRRRGEKRVHVGLVATPLIDTGRRGSTV